jgi:hypothetical protein
MVTVYNASAAVEDTLAITFWLAQQHTCADSSQLHYLSACVAADKHAGGCTPVAPLLKHVAESMLGANHSLVCTSMHNCPTECCLLVLLQVNMLALHNVGPAVEGTPGGKQSKALVFICSAVCMCCCRYGRRCGGA